MRTTIALDSVCPLWLLPLWSPALVQARAAVAQSTGHAAGIKQNVMVGAMNRAAQSLATRAE